MINFGSFNDTVLLEEPESLRSQEHVVQILD